MAKKINICAICNVKTERDLCPVFDKNHKFIPEIRQCFQCLIGKTQESINFKNNTK